MTNYDDWINMESLHIADALATPAEAAAFLRTTVGALAQDRYRNRGPQYIKRNRAVLYSWDALRKYVSENTMTGTSSRPGAA